MMSSILGRRIEARDGLLGEFDTNSLFNQFGNLIVRLAFGAELFDLVANHSDKGRDRKLLRGKPKSLTQRRLCGSRLLACERRIVVWHIVYCIH